MAKKSAGARAQKVNWVEVTVLLVVSLFTGIVGYLLGQAEFWRNKLMS